jgi:hypothetical protein
VYVGSALGVAVVTTFIVSAILRSIGGHAFADFMAAVMLLTDFALFVLLIDRCVRKYGGSLTLALLSGKWNPVDGRGEPLEFSGRNTVTRGDSLSGTVVVHKDKRMEIVSGGRVVEVWQLVKVDGSELVIHDASGTIKRFKKKSSNLLAALFESKRTSHLEGSWQPIGETTEWMEFTRDGAVVFSDGSAGKFAVSGEEPNEVIDLEMVGGATRRFRVVSLTPTQLVIAEGDEATTFRRPGRVAKSRGPGGGVAPADAVAPNGAGASAGVLGGLFSFFTRWKCPKCGQRTAEKTRSEGVGDRTQEVRSRYDPAAGRVRQVVVTLHTLRNHFQCKQCDHQWAELQECDRIA